MWIWSARSARPVPSTPFCSAWAGRGTRSGGTSKGRLFPLSRDELVECAALLDAVRRGEFDRLVVPRNSLDVLTQQIAAEVSSQEWREDALFDLVRGRIRYRDLQREEFDRVRRACWPRASVPAADATER